MPLRKQSNETHMPPNSYPTTVLIFGASGDLTKRKLIPALYNNYYKHRLPAGTKIVGFARSPYTDESFREKMREGIQSFSPNTYDAGIWESFATQLYYFQGDLSNSEVFDRLQAYLSELESGPANRLYYLATAPFLYPPAVTHLGAAGMAEQTDSRCNLVVEKPFGRDLASAQELNNIIHKVFNENQVYRIDHYLGKETSQNILYFRFANTIFEPVWNRRYISNIQISVLESVDVGQRASYFDEYGVIRDMFQNHLLQLLSLVTMEPPVSFDADAIRNDKVKLFSSIRPIALEDVVPAQYEGYRNVEGVDPASKTPTFAALRLYIDNWRWQGVPFYLRSGKALAEKSSEIVIEFNQPPHILFGYAHERHLGPNVLTMCLQPDEGIHLTFQAKIPDRDMETRDVDMEFHYRSTFAGEQLPDAYETLLLDALHCDAALFTRSDGIEAAWQLIDPILEGWQTSNTPSLATYIPGSWGPSEADELLAQQGHSWRMECGEHKILLPYD